MPRSDRLLCVYAIVRAGGTPAFRTGDGERLRVVRHGQLAAVVRATGSHPAPTPANLRRYDRAMQALVERFDPLLPARFGTCVSREELVFILSSRHAVLAPALARVRGRVQMTTRMMKGERAPLPRPASGTDYLRQRAQEAAVPEFDPVRSAVSRWIRDERAELRGAVATVYHLIPRSSVDAYRTAVQRAATASGLHIMVSGPWPPYAFASD